MEKELSVRLDFRNKQELSEFVKFCTACKEDAEKPSREECDLAITSIRRADVTFVVIGNLARKE